jgi:hypothetical protein
MKLLNPATKVLSIIALCFVFFVSCKKDDNTLDPTNPPTGSINGVYIAGMVDSKPVLWKDGVPTFLSPTSPNIGNAVQVLVSNNNVYVLGLTAQSGSPFSAIRVWKNGVESVVATGITGHVNRLHFDVYNDDVYVICNYDNSNNQPIQNKVYKNGVELPLNIGAYSSVQLTDVKVKNGNVYLTGYAFNANTQVGINLLYWVNGVLNTIPGTNSANGCYTRSLFISGSDIYIVGNDNLKEGYWKNGIKTILPYQSPYAESSGFSLFVYNNDVYLTGYQGNYSYENATYWKNNTITILTNYNTLNYRARFIDIFVKDNIIYNVGFVMVPTGAIPLYFQNNVPIPLSGITSTQKVYLFDIFVQ